MHNGHLSPHLVRFGQHFPPPKRRFYRQEALTGQLEESAGLQIAGLPGRLGFPAPQKEAGFRLKPRLPQKPEPFIFRTPNGEELFRAGSLGEFFFYARAGNIGSILYHAEKGHFAPWLRSLGQNEAAGRMAGFAKYYHEIESEAKATTDNWKGLLQSRLLSIIEPCLGEEDKKLLAIKAFSGVVHDPWAESRMQQSRAYLEREIAEAEKRNDRGSVAFYSKQLKEMEGK